MDAIYSEVFLTAFVAGLVIYLIFKFCDRGNKFPPDEDVNNTESQESNDLENKKKDGQKSTSKSKKLVIEKKKEIKDKYAHPWLLANLKGHSGQICDLDFSSNGKYLASCADDRAVMLWTVKTFAEKNHKSVRTNIEYDHATHVKWSPDNKAFIVCVSNENSIQVYKVGKKKDGSFGNVEVGLRFPVRHNTDIINIGIACNGLFIMSCSSDTTMIVWDLKGECLTTIDTLHMNNYHACISPCGRFVASSGFTPDVRVWEVSFSKSGEFKEVKRAFELKGHTSGVYCFSFSNDSSRMATVSKDGTWKLWDTNIQYSRGQEPYLLRTCPLQTSWKTTKPSIVLSSDGRTVAISSASDIFIYSAVNGDLQATLSEVHSEPIRVLLFSSDDQYLVAAAGRLVRVFLNVLGYKNVVLGLEEAKKHAPNQATKERLQSQIEEAKSSLKSLEELVSK